MNQAQFDAPAARPVRRSRSAGLFSSGGPGKGQRSAWLFLAPWLVGVVFFTVGPAIASFVISLTNWTLSASPSFTGVDNYARLTSDPRFWQSLRVTFTFLVMSVPIFMVGGLALALFLNQERRGIRLVRTVVFIPVVISGVAVGVLWAALLNRDQGVVNTLLRSIGLTNPPGWVQSTDWALPAIVLVGLWGIGASTIIYLAGLQNIPRELNEAASIDGANRWQRFRHITLPMLSPTLFYVLLISIIDAFQVFDLAYVLGGSRGGREGSLLFYLLNMWNEGFRSGRIGYAATLAVVLIVVSAVVIVVVFRTAERRVFYAGGDEAG